MTLFDSVKTTARRLVDTIASPVLVRELQSGMRARRIVMVQSGYLLCLAGIALLVILGHVNRGPNDAVLISAEAGRRVLVWLFVLQWVMVVLIAPSFTCSLLSSERERQTFDMVLASLLTGGQIVAGKLLFGVSYVVLLLISSLPITATAFFLGGVSPGELAVYYAILLVTGVLVCQFGLFFSSREKRTATATNQSYGMAFLWLIIGLVMAFSLIVQTVYDRNSSDLATMMTSTVDYHGVSLLKSMPLLLLVGWISSALFAKACNFVRNGAPYVLWMHRLFLWWSVASAIYVAMMMATTFERGDLESTVGIFWTFYSMAALFCAGLFTPQPVLHSRRDRALWARHISGRRLFFPVYLSLLGILPALVFYVEDGGSGFVDKTAETLTLIALWVFSFGAIAGALERLTKGRITYRVAHFGLFILSLASPLITVIQMPQMNEPPSFWSLYYMSPYTVMAGIWMGGPMNVGLGSELLPLEAVSAGFYLATALFFLGLCVVLRRNKVSAVARPTAGGGD